MRRSYQKRSRPAERLGSQIARRSVTSAFDDKKFLPFGELETIITEGSVTIALELDNSHELDLQLLRYILRHARILLATSCMCLEQGDLAYVLESFKNNGISDLHLPVTRANEETGGIFHGIFDDDPWDVLSKREFIGEKQWMFLAPRLDRSPWIQQLDPKHVLPFVFWDDQIKSGAFGDVSQVAIHERHRFKSMLTVSISSILLSMSSNSASDHISLKVNQQTLLSRK